MVGVVLPRPGDLADGDGHQPGRRLAARRARPAAERSSACHLDPASQHAGAPPRARSCSASTSAPARSRPACSRCTASSSPSTRADYALSSPEPKTPWSRTPNDWWTALATVSRRLMAQVAPGTRLLALAIGGQAPTLVAADADLRSDASRHHLARPAPGCRRGPPVRRASAQPVPVWGSWPAQAAWFVRNRPDAMRPDALAVRLSGLSDRAPDAHSGRSMLPTTGRRASTPPGSIRACCRRPGCLAKWSARSIAAAAEFTGLPAGTPVVGGYVDGVLGVLASGVRRPGDACLNGGTSGTLDHGVSCRRWATPSSA